MKKIIVFALTVMLISMGSYLKASQEEEALKLKAKAAELVTEIKTLITEGKYAQVKATVLEYAKAISGIQERLQDLETDTLQAVIDATEKHIGVLEGVLELVPEGEAQKAIARAIEVSIRGSDEAVKNLRERSRTQERATLRGFGFTDEDGDGVNDFSLIKWENRFYGLEKRMEHQYNWQHLNPVAGMLKAGNIPGLSLRPEFSLDLGRNKDRRTPPVTPPTGPPRGKN